MSPWLLLAVGVLLAGIGGDLFEKGLHRIANWIRIPAAIVGATISAFATSSPELSVSISAASAGVPEVALGDALGSNVVNLGLVLGLVSAIWGVASTRAATLFEFRIALLAPPLTFLLLFDGELSRTDGVLLLGAFVAWLATTLWRSWKSRPERAEAHSSAEVFRTWAQVAFGLLALIMAGRVVVDAAKSLGSNFGLDPFLVGATMVAFGTSVPELTTAILSQLRGRAEVGLGTVLGSNLFNGLFIVGLAATIHPISVQWTLVGTGLAFGLMTLAVSLPSRNGRIQRWQGLTMLGLYAAYVATLVAIR